MRARAAAPRDSTVPAAVVVVVGFGPLLAGRAVVTVTGGPAALGAGSMLLGAGVAGAFSGGAVSATVGWTGAVEVVVAGGGGWLSGISLRPSPPMVPETLSPSATTPATMMVAAARQWGRMSGEGSASGCVTDSPTSISRNTGRGPPSIL